MIDTDRKMAANALDYKVNSGLLESKNIGFTLGKNNTFGKEISVVVALVHTAGKAVIARDPDKSLLDGSIDWHYNIVAAAFNNPLKEKMHRNVDFLHNDNAPDKLKSLKDQPLKGIWASTPYLHNGSVPYLYALFLPHCSDAKISSGKKCGSNKFILGSREFDPKKVGFVQADKNKYPHLFEFNTALPDNRNTGHKYVTGKTAVIIVDENGKAIKLSEKIFKIKKFPPIKDKQRWARVEYLKKAVNKARPQVMTVKVIPSSHCLIPNFYH